MRDWLYVEDHCAGILLVLQRGRLGESYNIGGGNEKKNIEIVDTISATSSSGLRPAADNPALTGPGIASYHDLKKFVTDRKGHDRRYAIDADARSARAGLAAESRFRLGHGSDRALVPRQPRLVRGRPGPAATTAAKRPGTRRPQAERSR